MAQHKKHIKSVLVCVLSAMLLASCSAETASSSAGSTAPETYSADTGTNEASIDTHEDDLIRNGLGAVYQAGDEGSAVYDPEEFSSYTTEFSDAENKYMITIELNAAKTAFELTLEDSSFEFSTFEITAPENYTLNIPFSQDSASTVCSLIKNTVDDTSVPDILSFTFYLNNFDDESLAYSVKKFYSVKDGKICEIKLYDNTSGTSEPLEYCSDFTLYHTEPLRFMPAPVVSYDENQNASVNLSVYDFDPDEMTFTKNTVDTSFENSPLYYGYAAYATANDIAAYFTTTSLNVSDYENYVEVPSVSNSEINDYFFKVDDPRFTTVDELKEFTRKYFSEKLVTDMFLNAPQKYRDIDGSLYTIVGDGGMDFTLGQITITDYSENGNEITYHTKQEKFNDDGDFVDFIDGGDFVIERDPSNDTFKVTKYTLRY